MVEIDNSPAMLAANRLRDRVQATTEAIPLTSGSVDTVLCGLALGHLPRLQPTMDEIARVLKPGGAALVSDVHPSVALSGGQRTFRGYKARRAGCTRSSITRICTRTMSARRRRQGWKLT
ncbi:MAG: class I SAM-dependent methyltransferase [Anaerolineae bacterium]